jgi:hypothetical protein
MRDLEGSSQGIFFRPGFPCAGTGKNEVSNGTVRFNAKEKRVFPKDPDHQGGL